MPVCYLCVACWVHAHIKFPVTDNTHTIKFRMLMDQGYYCSFFLPKVLSNPKKEFQEERIGIYNASISLCNVAI